jgi:O-antigen ligase
MNEHPAAPWLTPARLIQLSLAFFLVSVAVGVWAAYDRQTAWMRAGLLAGGVLLAWSVAWIARRWGLRILVWGGAVAAILALLLFFLLLRTQRIDGNAIATAQIILLPLILAAWVWAARARSWGRLAVITLGALFALGALLAAGERSAWLGLLGGLTGAGLLTWRARGLRTSPRRHLFDLAVVLALLAGVAAFWYVLTSPALTWDLTVQLRDWGGERLELWSASLALAIDTLFTGAGLGSTPMVFSTYAFLYHVPFLFHAHNLYLQVWLEQGLIGLLALVGMIAGGMWALARALAWGDAEARSLALAAATALLGMAVAGLADAELYVSVLFPSCFCPWAGLWPWQMPRPPRLHNRALAPTPGSAPPWPRLPSCWWRWCCGPSPGRNGRPIWARWPRPGPN